MEADAVDLFSGGGGGWCLGLRKLGAEAVGLEWDGPSCATRAASGLHTIRCDVAEYPAERFIGVQGVIGSPPCQTFSSAGKRAGLSDPRGQLVYEPMRYVRVIRPRWVALEQVPEVLGYWRWIARELRTMGYSVWTGVLNTADYGVPQCRKRAILLASLDRLAAPPAPTHSKHGQPGMFGEHLPRWVSMAEALGWGGGGTLRTGTLTGGGSTTGTSPYLREADRPAPVVRGNSVGRWRVGTGRRSMEQEVDCDQPAPSVMASDGGRWKLLSPGRSYTSGPRVADPATDPAPTIALGHNAAAWCWERPATTIPAAFCNGKGGKGMVAPPGHHGTSTYTERNGAVPVEPWELGVLQGFPADHPWQSPHVSAQIGNAFPPPMAEACLRAVTGLA